MSHFVDLFQKANGPSGQSLSAMNERAIGFERTTMSQAASFHEIPVEELDIQPDTRIVYHGDPASPGADRFRLLRMRLCELATLIRLKTLLITSPLPHEGKSTVALNLATALAEHGKQRVLLIEGDLYHSCLAPRLNLTARAGLAECLEDASNPMPHIRRLEPLGWCLLSAGEPHRNPTELLQTEAFPGMMRQLSTHFDWILIDSPPVLPLTDALLLKQQTDASFLVVRAGQTPGNAVDEAIALLGPKHVAGVILNCAEKLGKLYSGYYYDSPYYKRERKTAWAQSKPNR